MLNAEEMPDFSKLLKKKKIKEIPEDAKDKDNIDENSQGILATDFELDAFLRARIIPKVVLYYTGYIIDDEDEDDDSYDGEEEEDDEESGEEKEHKTPCGNKKKPSPNECQQP
uniref:Uncharacterized protein n=1 Tax=Glossina brevipalpis TaxID=37001 RepID=A0A1A9WWF1_9MUSC